VLTTKCRTRRLTDVRFTSTLLPLVAAVVVVAEEASVTVGAEAGSVVDEAGSVTVEVVAAVGEEALVTGEDAAGADLEEEEVADLEENHRTRGRSLTMTAIKFCVQMSVCCMKGDSYWVLVCKACMFVK